MNVFGTYEHSIEAEQALAMLENGIVPAEQILVVPMSDRPSGTPVKGRTDSVQSNAFEVGIACATGTAVIGASSGFVLTPGPILCGLIAAIIGFAAGYLVYLAAMMRPEPFEQTGEPGYAEDDA